MIKVVRSHPRPLCTGRLVTLGGLLIFLVVVYFPSSLARDLKELTNFCPAGLGVLLPVLYQEPIPFKLSHRVIFCHAPYLTRFKVGCQGGYGNLKRKELTLSGTPPSLGLKIAPFLTQQSWGAEKGKKRFQSWLSGRVPWLHIGDAPESISGRFSGVVNGIRP